jgi:hypothetical protein
VRLIHLLICLLFGQLAMPVWGQTVDHREKAPGAQSTATPVSDQTSHSAKKDESLVLSARALNKDYTDSSGEALKICCYAAYCSFWGVNECNILSPEGKIIAFLGMGIGGIVGFMAGTSIAVSAYGVLISSSGPLPAYEVPADELLTFSFLSAAAGILSGAGLGALIGLMYDGTLSLLSPKPLRNKTKYKRPKESPPSPPMDDPPPAY